MHIIIGRIALHPSNLSCCEDTRHAKQGQQTCIQQTNEIKKNNGTYGARFLLRDCRKYSYVSVVVQLFFLLLNFCCNCLLIIVYEF